MRQTNVQDHRISSSGEVDFLKFFYHTVYGSHLGHVT